MINREYITVKSHWCDNLSNLFLYHTQGTKQLAVIFPGGDGCCDVPLLHYARKVSLLSGCDVLSLSYGHIHSHSNFRIGDPNFLIEESMCSINKCLERGYEKIFFISKSLGTLIAGEVSNIIGYKKVRNIFLTPLTDTIPHISKSICMVVTGTKDKYFTVEDIDTIMGFSNIKVKVYEGAVHSLEFDDDYKQSLKILNEVADICSEFIQTN